MKSLIFGGTGMLGHKLVQVLSSKQEVWTTVRNEFSQIERFGIFDRGHTITGIDIADEESVRRAIDEIEPDLVINAVGIIKQLPTATNIIQNLTVNSIFPQRLAEMSREYGFRLITVSTDCVFNGSKGNYSESDTPDSRDIYGLSKFLGEVADENTLTIRTSIIGRELETSHSLVEWFVRNPAPSVDGYVNAVYSGFPTVVLAELIFSIISDHPTLSGLYHISSEPITKFHLLELIRERYRLDVAIKPSEAYVIDRSLNSDKFKCLTGFRPDAWSDMVDRMAADPTPYDTWR